MKHKKIITGILIIVIIITLTGCEEEKEEKLDAIESLYIDENDNHTYEPEYGGELVFPLTTLRTLNPLITENIFYYHFSKLVYEGLFEMDNDLNIKNQLAEDYIIKEDGRVLSIKLKEDVLWHDGEPFTSEDVAFTINTIKYGNDETVYKKIFQNVLGTNNPAAISRIMDVQIIDNYNIDIIFNESFSNGLELLTFPIIPRHNFVLNVEDKQSYEHALEEDYIPNGTGPYKFLSYEKLKSIKLEANDNYRNGKPYIKQVIGKILQDKELTLMAFERGEIDATITQDINWERYDQNNRIKIYEFISQNYEFLGFNFSKGLFSNEKNKALRKAINYGINRQEIIGRVFLGHSTQVDQPIHPDSWLLSQEGNVYGYNPLKARQEIEKIGWKDVNGNGFYEDENGNEIVLKLVTNSYNPLRLKAADMIVDDLRKIGINVVKDYEEFIPENITEEIIESQWEDITNKILKGDYDIALLGWNLSGVPDLIFAYHSSKIQLGSNLIRYNTETMDNMLQETFNASSRENKLKAYKNLQNLITEELPYVSLYFKNNALLVDKKVMGDINPSFCNIYKNIDKWYIPKEFQKR